MQVMAIGSLDYNLDRVKAFYTEHDLIVQRFAADVLEHTKQ